MPLFARGPKKPKKPDRPTGPSKPRRREPVIVKTYHAEGFGSEKKMARMFEDEARRLAKDGYLPTQTTSQGAKPASMLMGGLGIIKGGYLTVTYILSPEAKAAEQAAFADYETYKRDEPGLMAEWKIAVMAWEAECRRIDRDHAQEKALASTPPVWPVPESASIVDASQPQVAVGLPVSAATEEEPPALFLGDEDALPSAEQPAAAIDAGLTATGLAPVGDVVERLKALSDLRAAGIVSDAEYEAKRTQLLARL